ncbi:hypothetical protein VTN31DRAFT_1207 [Thermomyces dupontii]|uniref:uncharacterized protein n=1 Tax=Talaromyces thermophilus TaxID=28565 RepID=UPI000392AA12
MVFRWLVNAGLLAIPIGTTIGVLVGIDAQRQASGQEPLFAGGEEGGLWGGTGPPNTGGSGNPDDDRVTTMNYCQKSFGIHPPSRGQKYILNPNQWGVTDDDSGALCMNVTSFNNGTYATNLTAPEFSVTWQYDPGPESQPVHAFPNIMLDSDILPVDLRRLRSIDLTVEWTYGVGNKPAARTDESELAAQDVNANVAIDLFVDSDKSQSTKTSDARYEIMIWFAGFGAATQPLGLAKGSVGTQTINGTTFNLYTGRNGVGQQVLTWVPASRTERFSGDILPLLSQPTGAAAIDFPADTDYLGYIAFGTEAFSSKTNVTFSVPNFALDVQTS